MTLMTNEIILITALRDCIRLRDTMNFNGLSDSSGALSSVAYLLDFLSLRRKYGTDSRDVLKISLKIERTVGVSDAIALGEEIRVENVYSLHDWALKFIQKVNDGFNDNELLEFIDEHYRLILVTSSQSLALAKLSVSHFGMDRFEHIGLKIDTQSILTMHVSSKVH